MHELWNWGYAWSVLPDLVPAIGITIKATVFGFILAMVLGLALALLRRAHSRLVSVPTAGFIEAVRSTPPLIQIYFLFFALPAYGVTMSALVAGTIGLGVHYATYCSEVYRAGLDGVERGQWEAATSLNLSTIHVYKDIIVPQALPPIVPALGNYLLDMLKMTPILSAIAVVEVMREALNVGSHNFRYIEPITLVGLFFLVLSLVAAAGIRRAENWLRRKILG